MTPSISSRSSIGTARRASRPTSGGKRRALVERLGEDRRASPGGDAGVSPRQRSEWLRRAESDGCPRAAVQCRQSGRVQILPR